jgi:hypothetical protein
MSQYVITVLQIENLVDVECTVHVTDNKCQKKKIVENLKESDHFEEQIGGIF